MNYKIILSILIFISITSTSVFSQVGINTDGMNPDSSAMLDVRSTDKGMLVPRMDRLSRTAIQNPATGLMVYDTDSNSFWYFDSTVWVEIKAGSFNVAVNDGIDIKDTCVIVVEMIDVTPSWLQPDFATNAANSSWQSIVSEGLDFPMQYIDVLMLDAPSGALINIYEGQGTGGNLLYTTSVTLVNGWNTIDVSSSNISISNNGIYTVSIVANSGTFKWSNGPDLTPFNPLANGRSDFDLDSDYAMKVHSSECKDLPIISPNNHGQSVSLHNIQNIYDEDGDPFSPILIADTDADTKIQVEKNADEDIIRFDIKGSESLVLERIGTYQKPRLSFLDDDWNIYIGENVGTGQSTQALHNTIIGYSAFTNNNNNGGYNTALGSRALSKNTGGRGNTAIGVNAGFENEGGDYNILIGNGAGYGTAPHDKNNNVMIGHSAGLFNHGNGNVFLGYNAGWDETGNNRLFIENSDADSTGALIYGEFDNDFVRINGDLVVTGTYPGSDDQTIDYMVINGDGELEISLENDGEAPKTISLSSIDTDTDDQSIDVLNLDGTTLEISLEDDGIATQTVDLSSIDTDTDNQVIDVLNLNGTTLEISLEGDEMATETLDLSSIDTDDQTLSYNDTNQSVSISGGNTLDLSQLAVPVGSIMMWYTATPPNGWLICEGSNVPVQYTELIGIVGNQLPDLEGRFVLGAGERNAGSNHPLLSTGGVETVELQEANIPAHTHDVNIRFREGEENGGGNDYSDLGDTSGTSNRTYQSDSWGGVNGNTLPHQNMPPFLTLHYITKAE